MGHSGRVKSFQLVNARWSDMRMQTGWFLPLQDTPGGVRPDRLSSDVMSMSGIRGEPQWRAGERIAAAGACDARSGPGYGF